MVAGYGLHHPYPPVLSEGNVFLDAPRPRDVQHVLVQRQHEHNQHEQRVEHGEEEDAAVPEVLEAGSDFSLENEGKQN